jgi:hypothetical protein
MSTSACSAFLSPTYTTRRFDLQDLSFSSASPRWIIARRAPGGDAYYSVVVNSFVHVIMYTYYLLAMYRKSLPAGAQGVLTLVGKNVTRLQMTQVRGRARGIVTRA